MTDYTNKELIVLGSTGSIGTQTLESAELIGMPVKALAAGKNVKLMEEEIRRFKPKFAALADEAAARELREKAGDTETKILSGNEGVLEIASLSADIVVSALVGTAGLRPSLAAARSGKKRIALANKETLVCAGKLFLNAVSQSGCELIPVDSEHSAIFQSLAGGKKSEVSKILLTASGGPFFNLKKEEFSSITKERALRHPNWSMGAKVTIDSATMMNKGLEVIEAMHLFSVPAEKIQVLIHPQSIVHSMVQFCDNSVIAQLGVPDMRIPIQYALTYPVREKSLAAELDLFKLCSLEFYEPDLEKFACLKLAVDVAERDDAAPAVMNGADEAAVELFMEEKIRFDEIPELILAAVENLGSERAGSVEDILRLDKAAKEFVLSRKA